MMLIVTRPEEDAEPLRIKLEALGHRVTVAPLMTIVPRAAAPIPDLPYQFAAVTSANGIRALHDRDRLGSLRILTVGPQSLAAARAAGFTKAEAHGGDVAGLARHVRENFKPSSGPILYLSGAGTAGDLAGELGHVGFECIRVIVYDAVPAHDLGAAAAALRSDGAVGVLLYSPGSARIWRSLAAEAGVIEYAAMAHYFCLSANVARLLPENWPRSIAETPDEAAMLALLEQIAGTR